MKKKLSFLLASMLCITLALSSCSGSGGTTTDVASTPSSGGSSASPASDVEVHELILQNGDAAQGTTSQFLDAWIAAVEEAGGGRLKIKAFHGGALGPMKDSYDMVKNGTADIAWGLPSMNTGKFPLTDVVALPFIGATDSLQASYALWDLYDSTDYLKDEWSEVKVILLHTNCDAPLMTNGKQIFTPEDLQGMKIRVNGGPPTEFMTQIGANPISMGIADVYTSLEKNVINAATSCGWDVVNAFKLYEQADYICDYAFHVNPYFFVMNWDSYNALPADLQTVIDEYSGYKALEIVGSRWQDVKAAAIAAAEEADCQYYTLTNEQLAAFQEIGATAREAWMADIDASGVDAQALVDALVERLEAHADKAA